MILVDWKEYTDSNNKSDSVKLWEYFNDINKCVVYTSLTESKSPSVNFHIGKQLLEVDGLYQNCKKWIKKKKSFKRLIETMGKEVNELQKFGSQITKLMYEELNNNKKSEVK